MLTAILTFLKSYRVYLIFSLIIAVISAAGLGYFVWSQNHMAELAKQYAHLEIQVQNLQNENLRMRQEAETIRQESEKLSSDLTATRLAAEKAKEALAKHDLGAMASAKSSLIEKKANNATRLLFRQLEEISREP